MKKIIFALDDGYGDVKCATGHNEFYLPSQYTQWRELPKSELSNNKLHPFDYIGAEIDGSKYVIGKGASIADSNISWVGGENKHSDIGFPLILKTCLGMMGNKEKMDIDTLVMGLPVKAEENQTRHELLQKLVVKEHEVRITLADGQEFNRILTVKELIIKKQPFGSFCDVIMDRNGHLVKKQTASEFNVIVDVGARTLNIYTLDALSPVRDLSDTTNNGLFEAYQNVGKYVEAKLGYAVPMGKLPNVIKKGMINRTDLTPVINRSYELLANEIKKVIDTKFVNSWAFVDRIIFTGGGSTVLKPYLSPLFKDKENIFLGRLNTARGLQKYGVRQSMKQTI
jgi:plasmid segregation protein ParM